MKTVIFLAAFLAWALAANTSMFDRLNEQAARDQAQFASALTTTGRISKEQQHNNGE